MAVILVPGTLAAARVEAGQLLERGTAPPVSIFRVTHFGDLRSKTYRYECFTEAGAAAIARVSPLCAFIEEWSDLAALRAARLR